MTSERLVSSRRHPCPSKSDRFSAAFLQVFSRTRSSTLGTRGLVASSIHMLVSRLSPTKSRLTVREAHETQRHRGTGAGPRSYCLHHTRLRRTQCIHGGTAAHASQPRSSSLHVLVLSRLPNLARPAWRGCVGHQWNPRGPDQPDPKSSALGTSGE